MKVHVYLLPINFSKLDDKVNLNSVQFILFFIVRLFKLYKFEFFVKRESSTIKRGWNETQNVSNGA